MSSNYCRFAFLVAVLSICTSSSAIIRRHDRDDARYLELGAKYPAVTRLGGGTATLIDPRWLITAGHVAANLSPFDRYVRLAGKTCAIDGVVLHPQWRAKGRKSSIDLALVRLAAPVAGVEPIGLYDRSDEHGQRVIFVGPGMYGNGLTGPQGDDGRWRGATNTVASATGKWVTFTFDAPPDGTDLEGISGPGDSGGPALLEERGRVFVLGVSSANDDVGADGPCRYHSTEYYARVSPEIRWVRETMKSGVPAAAKAAPVVDLGAAPWPGTPAGQTAAAFFKAYACGSDACFSEFERTCRADAALHSRSVEQRVESWRGYRSQWGALKPTQYVEGGNHDLHVLLRAEHEGVWKSFRFVLEANAPHKLTGIEIASPVVKPD